MYPTDVFVTPASWRNACSVPQKQPAPNVATAAIFYDPRYGYHLFRVYLYGLAPVYSLGLGQLLWGLQDFMVFLTGEADLAYFKIS